MAEAARRAARRARDRADRSLHAARRGRAPREADALRRRGAARAGRARARSASASPRWTAASPSSIWARGSRCGSSRRRPIRSSTSITWRSSRPTWRRRPRAGSGSASSRPGDGRLEVGGAFLELRQGEPGLPERPLLNHLGVLVDSVEEHQAEAEDLGVEIDDLVDAPNTVALFVWGPDRVKLEYIEHKPSFSLT